MALVTTAFMMHLSILLMGFTGLLYWFATKTFNHWRKKSIQYFPPKPFVGNLQDLVLGKMCMGELLGKLYFESPGKPYMGMFAFHRPILLVRDPDVIKSILVKDFNSFSNRTFNPDVRYDPLFAKNLFGVNMPKWKHIRVKLTPTFTSGKMKHMYEFVNECGKELINVTDCELQQNENGVLECRQLFARYTTDVTASVGFGVEGNALKDPDAEFRRVLRKVVEFEFWKGLKAAAAFFAPELLTALRLRVWETEITEFCRRVVWQTVEHRERTNLVRKDFLDLLMQIRAKGHVDGDDEQQSAEEKGRANGEDAADSFELDGDDFVAQAFIFMAAGFETSSSTQAFAAYELALNPDVQTRLREEIRSVLRANGGQLTYEAMQGMAYLNQVVQETLRLYPVVPFLDRMSVKAYPLPKSNAMLEEGTTVMIPIYGIQRDPQIFDEPNAFRPERFAEGAKSIPNFAFMPFGEGPRNCIGMRMGLMQSKVGLVHFLNHFEVSPSDLTTVPLVMDSQSFILASRGGIHLTVTKLLDAVY